MYPIQFAQRAHFLSDAAAKDVLEAMREQKPFVTVPIELAADGGDHSPVTPKRLEHRGDNSASRRG